MDTAEISLIHFISSLRHALCTSSFSANADKTAHGGSKTGLAYWLKYSTEDAILAGSVFVMHISQRLQSALHRN